MKNNKGVSAVIATVLIILITIAAVAILWKFVIPLLTGNMSEGTNCFSANLDEMRIDESYTCKNTNNISVQIARGTKDYNLTDIQVLVKNSEGVKKTFFILDKTTISPVNATVGDLPLQNEEKVYIINSTGIVNPVSVEIAPVVTDSKQICEVKQPVELRSC